MILQIALRDIPTTGMEFEFNEQALWLEPIKEFRIPCTLVDKIQAKVFLLKQDDGCLIRGTLTGKVSLPCDRCGEISEYPINAEFDEFELLPQSDIFDNNIADELPTDDTLIRFDIKTGHTIDIASLLWEEFALALPVKPLCKRDCKGLCPLCGTNLNTTDCICDKTSTDPRLEKLKNFKFKTK